MAKCKKILALAIALCVALTSYPAFAEDSDADLLYQTEGTDTQLEFNTEDIFGIMGTHAQVPVLKAEKAFKIDGSSDDWQDYFDILMPVDDSQYYDISLIDGHDLKVKLKYAWDNKFLYMFVEAEDDVHSFTEGSTYWNGDSIQFVIGKTGEAYGNQFGFVYDDNQDKSYAYSTYNFDSAGVKVNEFSTLKDNQAKVSAKRENGTTYYEIALSWDFACDGKPDEFLSSIIVNDNDGDVREYGLELAPGIGIGKNSNAEFPLFKLKDTTNGFYTWINANKTPEAASKNTYDVYIANVSAKDEFKVKYNSTEKTVSVPQGKTAKIPFEITVDELITKDLEFTVTSNGKMYKEVFTVNTKATSEYVKNYAKKLSENLKVIKTLMDECKAKNIPVEYENVAYTVLSRWADVYLPEEALFEWFTATSHNLAVLENMYTETKANLEAYLKGTKQSKNVPMYTTSDVKIDKFNVTANTIDSFGNKAERPVHFIGFGHFSEARADVPVFNDFGYNTIQNEIGPSSFLYQFPAWVQNLYGKGKADVMVADGKDGGKSMKIVHASNHAEGDYAITYQNIIHLTPGKTYTVSFDVKAENANGVKVSANGGTEYHNLDNGTYDWKPFTFDFTVDEKSRPNEDAPGARVWIVTEDVTDGIYFDNFKLTEKGGNVNYILNGDMEGGKLAPSGDYYIYTENAKIITDMLKNAEKGNVAVSLLISPHYFPAFMYRKYPGLRYETEIGAGNWTAFVPTHEKSRQVIGDYLDAFLPLLKGYTSLNDICLTNEPGLAAWTYGDYYLKDWQTWLKEKYNGDIKAVETAHNKTYGSFENIPFPLKATERYPLKSGGSHEELAVFDVIKFSTDVHVKYQSFLKDKVKQHLPDMPVHAKAQGTLGIHGGFPMNLANGASFEQFNSFSDIAGCDYSIEWLGLTTGSHEWLGESMWYDFLAGIGEKPISNSEDHIMVDNEENFHDGQAKWYDANLWQGAIHHRRYSQLWVWHRSYSRNIYYGSPQTRPDCVYTAGKVNLDLNRLAYEVQSLTDSKEDIAVLYSEVSRHLNPDHMRASYNAYEASLFNGKKVRIVTEGQIEKINTAKYLVIAGARHISADAMAEILKFAENGGKIIMIGNDNLSYDHANLKHTNGINTKIYSLASKVIPLKSEADQVITPNQEELSKIFEDYFKAEKIQNVWLVDEKTGKKVDTTEWTVANHNGTLLVNACYYSFDDKREVKLMIDGKVVKGAKELRSGDILGDTFTLEGCHPVLIQVGEPNHPFTDVFSHWAEEHIANLYMAKTVNGTSATTFEPEGTVRRAEFIKMVLNATGIETEKYNAVYNDIKPDDWFADYIYTAHKNGLIDNLAIGNDICPEMKITREEMCAVLMRAYELKAGNPDSDIKAEFTDLTEGSEWAVPYIEMAYASGLMNGFENGTFKPNDFSTRAEAATVIDRYLNIIK